MKLCFLMEIFGQQITYFAMGHGDSDDVNHAVFYILKILVNPPPPSQKKKEKRNTPEVTFFFSKKISSGKGHSIYLDFPPEQLVFDIQIKSSPRNQIQDLKSSQSVPSLN